MTGLCRDDVKYGKIKNGQARNFSSSLILGA